MKPILIILSILATISLNTENAFAQVPPTCGVAGTPDPQPLGWTGATTATGLGCRKSTNYNGQPTYDHDNDAYTWPRCWDMPIGDNTTTQWEWDDEYNIHWVVKANIHPNGPYAGDPNVRHSSCITYYRLPDRYCTGTGVSNSGRLVLRRGAASLTYQTLGSLTERKAWCDNGTSYSQGSCPSAYGGANNYDSSTGCCGTMGWSHIANNQNGTCAPVLPSVP